MSHEQFKIFPVKIIFCLNILSWLKPKYLAEMYQFHHCYRLCHIPLELLVSSSFIRDVTASPPTGNSQLTRIFLLSLASTPEDHERSVISSQCLAPPEWGRDIWLPGFKEANDASTHVLVFKSLLHWNREEWCYQSAFGFIAASSPGLFSAEPWEYKKVVFQQVNHLISAGKSPAAVPLWEVLSHLFNS